MALEHQPTCGFFMDDAALDHDPGPMHPESPARYKAVREALRNGGFLDQWPVYGPRKITREDLARVHRVEYLQLAEEEIHRGALQLSTGDTQVNHHSWDAAVLSAGCAVAAVDSVAEGLCRRAFSPMRPPGHHATAYRGMGFCILNNVAVAARAAQQALSGSRVLILDWDVHHGNGTQDIFYEDGSVFYCSLHQEHWYPFTGAEHETGLGEGKGATLNLLCAPGSTGDDQLSKLHDHLTPAMQTFQPNWILISAGFDSRAGDPLGELALEDEDFFQLTRYAIELAEEHAEGRLVSVLEGGYHLRGLGSAVSAHASALSEP